MNGSVISVKWGEEILHPDPRQIGSGNGQACLVIRLGGLGDTLFATPVVRLFAEMGYAVSVYSSRTYGPAIFLNNPHVQQLYTFRDLPWDAELLNDIQKYHHQVINLQECIENKIVFRTSDPRYRENHWQRQTSTDFSEATLAAAGLSNPERKIVQPELYIGDVERNWLEQWTKKNTEEGRMAVLWNPLGSSFNKTVLQTPQWMQWVLDTFPQADVYIIGDGRNRSHPIMTQQLMPIFAKKSNHGRVHMHAGTGWGLRMTLVALSRADLFIGPESGLAVAAGGSKTPKILFWSSSAPYNVSKYWFNVYSVPTTAICSPCYRVPEEPEDHPECTQMGPDGEFTGAYCMNGLSEAVFQESVRSVLEGRKDRTCPYCGSTDFREHVPGWVQCICRSIYRAGSAPGLMTESEVQYLMTPRQLGRQEHMVRSLLGTFQRQGVITTPGSLFEVGAASGIAMAAARSEGWSTDGIDIHPLFGGLRGVRSGDFLEGSHGEGADVIWMSHVLHATADPVGMFTQALRRVNPEGAVVIITPDTNAPDLKSYREQSCARALPSMRWIAETAKEFGFVPASISMNTGTGDSGYPYQNDVAIVLKRIVGQEVTV